MNITTQNNKQVAGTLEFKNFEKDSSHGTLVGIYENDLLVGDYSFSSEGMNSVRQVAFKKSQNGFVEGFGDVETKGNKEVFKDSSKLTFDNSYEFKKVVCSK